MKVMQNLSIEICDPSQKPDSTVHGRALWEKLIKLLCKKTKQPESPRVNQVSSGFDGLDLKGPTTGIIFQRTLNLLKVCMFTKSEFI